MAVTETKDYFVDLRLRPTKLGWMFFMPSDNIVGKSFDLFGEYSTMEEALIKKFFQPGWTAVDVGANIGGLTLPMANAVGPTGQVIAFEPQLVVFNLLVANVFVNGYFNVDCRRQALGREKGTVQIPVFNYNHTQNYGAVGRDHWGKGVDTDLLALDMLNLRDLHFLKVDVEGMEQDVLIGAKETIARCRPLMFVEADREGVADETIRLIKSFNYTPCWYISFIYNEQNYFKNPENPFGGMCSFNLFCLPNGGRWKVEGLAVAQEGDKVGEVSVDKVVQGIS